MKKRTLFVDTIIPNDLGGITNDLKKAEYILATIGTSFKEIIENTPSSTKIPSLMFGSGKYVVLCNIKRDLTIVNLGLINYKIDLEDNFDLFADSYTPKAVAGFHKIAEQIKMQSEEEKNRVSLSDNDSDFVIAYGSYIEYMSKNNIKV